MNQSVLLYTADIAAAIEEIESLGGHVTHRFTDSAFVALLDDTVDASGLSASTVDAPTDLDGTSALMAAAWQQRPGAQPGFSAAPPANEGLTWDAEGLDPLHLPDGGPDEGGDDPGGFGLDDEPQLSTGTSTSEYMVGSIAVGVVIVGGTGTGLGISAAEQQLVISEVQEGLDFLATLEPRAKISWVYDIHTETVSAAPGDTADYETAEAPWRNAALENMGFAASRQGSRDYVNNLRASKGTDWAYVAYFTKYPLRHFAYAVREKTTMHIDNDGWGRDSINRVFAHETCHIFGAADEYGSCSCDGSHGHLGVPNNNCVNCTDTQVNCLMDGNVLEMCTWSRRQLGWDESLFPDVATTLSGRYHIKQKSSGRFLDAHEQSDNDFSVVTRTSQSNSSQRWILNHVGQVCTIQQQSNGRFLDAHTTDTNDFALVTRTAQNNDTQRWVLMATPGRVGAYTIQHLTNGRFVDAHDSSANDFAVVTRTAQNNDTQRWDLNRQADGSYTMQQVVNGRFVDAHENSGNNFGVVTRPQQSNSTQRWLIKPVAGVYTLQQQLNGRNVDAHEGPNNDFSLVTRVSQYNDTQRWVLTPIGATTYTIQQLSNGRFVDAHQNDSEDFSVVTRTAQNNDTQRWIFESV